MEESKLNQIHLLGKDKPPLKLLFWEWELVILKEDIYI